MLLENQASSLYEVFLFVVLHKQNLVENMLVSFSFNTDGLLYADLLYASLFIGPYFSGPYFNGPCLSNTTT